MLKFNKTYEDGVLAIKKLKEYGITDEQLQICSYICLDGVIVKDRWGLAYLPQQDKQMEIDMSNIDVIIGVNGHILYSKGQTR